MAKALNIPWDEENIKESRATAKHYGFGSLASYVKYLLIHENQKRKQSQSKEKPQ